MQLCGQPWRSITLAQTLSKSSKTYIIRPLVPSSSTAPKETGSEQQLESDRGVYSHLWYLHHYSMCSFLPTTSCGIIVADNHRVGQGSLACGRNSRVVFVSVQNVFVDLTDSLRHKKVLNVHWVMAVSVRSEVTPVRLTWLENPATSNITVMMLMVMSILLSLSTVDSVFFSHHLQTGSDVIYEPSRTFNCDLMPRVSFWSDFRGWLTVK